MDALKAAVAALFAALLFAPAAHADSVKNVTAAVAPSAGAGARTQYTVGFTTSPTGSLAQAAGQGIAVTMPAEADLGVYSGGAVVDVGSGQTVGSCPSHTGQAISCTLFSGVTIAANAAVRMTLNAIVNPAVAQGYLLSVATTKDTAGTAGFTIQPAHPLTGLTLANTGSTGAGARTQYVAAYTTSSTGGLAQIADSRITAVFSAGTDLTTYTGGTVTDTTTAQPVGSCPTRTGQTITCTVFGGVTIPNGDAVKLTFNAITNPAPGAVSVQVNTTSDTAVITSNDVTVDPTHALTGLTLANTGSTGAGARTQYVANYTGSSTGAVAQVANSRITAVFSAGTDLTTYTGGTVTDTTTGQPVGSCPTRAGQTITCTLFGDATIPNAHAVKLVFNAVTNPTGGAVNVQVNTTSDTTTVTSNNVTVDATHALTGLTLSNTGSTGAGARTQYVATYTTSSTGAIAQVADSRITAVFSAGTDLTTYTGGTVTDTTTAQPVGSCPTRAGQTITCTLFGDATIPNAHAVKLVFNAVTNPTGATVNVQVNTTSDTTTVTSNNVTVDPTHPLTGLTLANTGSTGAGARTQYVATYTTSTTGAVSQVANSRITAVFSPGTDLTTYTGGTVTDTTTGQPVGSCPTRAGQTITCTLFGDAAIPNGDAVRLVFNAITNPTGATVNVQVNTTSDTTTVTSNQAAVDPGHSLTGLTATPASSAQGATTQYVVRYLTSSTGALAQVSDSRITVTFPSGTTFGSYAGGAVFDETRNESVGSCPGRSGLIVTCTLFSAAKVDPNDSVRITFTGVTNPSAISSYTLNVATTSDLPAVTSQPYGVAVDTTPPDTTLADGLAFSASEPGTTFECSLDGGGFSACTSPYVPPAGLAAGQHTLAVRAVDGAGNRDPSPASRTFSVAVTAQATPTAVPTAAPQPTPTPQPGRTVVAAPVSGKVLVKLPGAKGFVEVDAAQGIPLGSIVDARKGTIQLTAKAGETAKFHDGLFKVTQTRATTDLTLTEPLAPCGKRATAAGKKPKTRRLWGDGTGSFRTRGQYSAATVRGTTWLVQDSCSGTLTKVTKGVVSVTDNVKHKTILLKAGKQYLAKPKR